jgi:hypothetical protein
MISAIQNFQIPVIDFDLAHKFYSELMGYELQVMDTPDSKLGIFQFDESKGTGGCIIQSEGLEPSKTGTMVYLHLGQNLQPSLDRTKDAGGLVFVEKNQLGSGMGFYGIIEDTEGNRVGLFSEE